MAWIVAAVVIVLMVWSPVFRLLAVGAFIVALAALLVWNHQLKVEAQQSLTRIALSELTLEDLALTPSEVGYDFTGRITNRSSAFTLRGVTVRLVMKDCPGETATPECVVIGQRDDHVLVSIPPAQARDFKDLAYFGSLKPRGRLTWSHEVTAITADR